MKRGAHHIIAVSNGKGWCEHCEEYVDLEDMHEVCEGNIIEEGVLVEDGAEGPGLPGDDDPEDVLDDFLDDIL